MPPANFFETHCTDCRHPETRKRVLDLTSLKRRFRDPENFARWSRARHLVQAGEMRTSYDLIRLGFETDSKGIISLFIQPLGVASEIAGVSRETHSFTHHGSRPEMIEELRKSEVAQFAAG